MPTRAHKTSTRHLTEQDLSVRWGIAIPTLRKWRSVGCGPKFLKIGKLPRYRFEDVLAYEQRNLHGSGESDLSNVTYLEG